jgi:COP9 signalosome complex subunit 2
VPEHDVEQLLVSLILDNRIQGHIDQVNRLLERSDRSVSISYNWTWSLNCVFKTWYFINVKITLFRSKGMKKYPAVDKWNTQLKSLYQTINNRVG